MKHRPYYNTSKSTVETRFFEPRRETKIGFRNRVVEEIESKTERRETTPGGGGTPYNGLYGEAPPERGPFFRLQVYKKVGIS